ncbi:diaminopimelate decarboxylase [Adhaeribacter pallidiroseus]|uniref:Diaminopimelate decarboxylase n=1 Tax=Adhaeribacter pallidiroseus TaxID=2072847 RepID=A0A369QDE7_9BACT|nr:diaminopimelate decarboxylase [Adhaeribacter pallidiroseus]RDC62442.1 Diaminopimelate decarboxylase [Adhaeribacter pallidiroseus]
MRNLKEQNWNGTPTPFYYYDLDLLKQTLETASTEAAKYGYHIHYALKANSNEPILKLIQQYGLGADCVSGNEIKQALANGFEASQVVFAGVGKSDAEIKIALNADIFCFNCESVQELEVLNELAQQHNQTARIALRINPNVNANTHKYITTGLEENKFGINTWELPEVLNLLKQLPNLELIGIHFHIGSQITDLQVFEQLCVRVNEIQQGFRDQGYHLKHLNVGGGLGVDYYEPESNAIPDFAAYFAIFNRLLQVQPGQVVHYELGRALVAQCGTLVSRVLYIKKGQKKNFAILDAGMTELIRPMLYQAYHKIENLSSHLPEQTYDVVGPICESSDCFAQNVPLPETHRHDVMAIRTAGAYAEVMASNYNLREKAVAIYSSN